MKASEFKKLIREEVRKVINEANYDMTDMGQGSGSQSFMQKGRKISISSVKPGMRVMVSYVLDSGQGSGSQGYYDVAGVVKSINPEFIMVVPDDLDDYKQKFKAKYQKEGKPIAISTINNISSL